MADRAGPWAVSELHDLLAEFEAELREAGLGELTVRTYVDRSRYFVRWLDGDYTPRGGRSNMR
jgi:hypothetical protein